MRPERMSFGMFMAPFHRVGDNPSLAIRRDLELIDALDALGYDEAWIGEHHSAGWELIADPVIMIAAAAERTKQIKLGSGVVSLPYHHPLMVADRFVQLDHLTRGRVMLGVGPGALVSDAYMMGIDPVTQRPRMDEALGVILRLLQARSSTIRPIGLSCASPAAVAPLHTALFSCRSRRPDVAGGDDDGRTLRRGRAIAGCRNARRQGGTCEPLGYRGGVRRRRPAPPSSARSGGW